MLSFESMTHWAIKLWGVVKDMSITSKTAGWPSGWPSGSVSTKRASTTALCRSEWPSQGSLPSIGGGARCACDDFTSHAVADETEVEWLASPEHVFSRKCMVHPGSFTKVPCRCRPQVFEGRPAGVSLHLLRGRQVHGEAWHVPLCTSLPVSW